VSAEPTADQPTTEEIRRTIDDILGGSEFREPTQGWISQAFDSVSEWVNGLFTDLVGGGFQSAVAAIVFAVLGATAFFVVRSVRRVSFARESFTRPTATSTSEASESADRWLELAIEHEVAGRFGDALRCRHQAMTVALGQDGRIDLRPSATAGEIERDIVARVPRLEGSAAALTERFERVWYGGEEATSADLDRAAKEATDLSRPWPRR
jgi:hypothetical protein